MATRTFTITQSGATRTFTVSSGVGATGADGADGGGGDALVADPLSQFAATTSAQLAGVLTDETGTGSAVFATSPTLTSPVLNTGVSGSAILDEDDLASDSDTQLATQQSIKAYVDDAIKAVTITAKVNEAGGITKGQVVFISGATGGFPQVSLADNTDFSKADVLAVSTETKTDGQNVAITIAGLVENIDTSAYTEGAVLYLGTSGNITEIHPTGIHAVERIGHAVKINASTGSILVELDGLTVINDHDGIMRHQIVNQNAGTSASAAYTIVNDALRRSSISMVGSNYNVVAGISNSLIIYNEGYNKTVNAVDGNYGFEWWTDETDSHNLTSTSKMSLTADGELNTLVQTIDHTATEADDHALEIDCDAAGFGDVKAIDVAYDTGAITPWQDEAVMLVNINQSAAIGGDVTALEVLATEGSANINGMLAGAGVNPIEQLSGVFYDMDSALVNATDRLTEFTTAGNDVQMFVADNDTVTIASFAKFEQLQFILAITASLSIRPTFEFSTGPGTWTAFTPVDGTNGMRNTGVIAWLSGDIPTWAVGTGGKYLIRITRKRNSLATPPTESKVQIAATTAYKWDKDGDLIVNTVTATGNVESANTGANAPVSTAQQAAHDATDPARIPGLLAGYRIADTTRTGSDIDVWLDISGNGRHATADGTEHVVTTYDGDEVAIGGGLYSPAVSIPFDPEKHTHILIYKVGGALRVNTMYQSTFALTNGASSGGGFLTDSGSFQFYNATRKIGALTATPHQNNSITARYGVAQTSVSSNGVVRSGAVNGSATVTEFVDLWGYAGGGSFVWGHPKIASYYYDRVLSDDEVLAIEKFHSIEKPPTLLVFAGDSFVAGTGASVTDLSYPILVSESQGISASCIGGQGAQSTAFVAANLTEMLATYTENSVAVKVILDVGKNDLAANITSATLQGTLTTVINAITGSGFDLVVVSIPPRNTGFSGGADATSYETQRLLFNTWLRSQEGTLFEKLADAGADSRVGDVADLGTGYYGDGIHPTDSGHAVWAELIEAELDAL